MPSCADSLRSSSTGWPSGPTPIGTRSRSRGGRGRPRRRRRRALRVGEAEQRRPGPWSAPVSGCRRGPPAGQPQRRQPAGQRLGLGRWRGASGPTDLGRRRLDGVVDSRPSDASRARSRSRSSGRGGAPSRSSRVTPSTPPSAPRWPQPARSPPSSTTTRCGAAPRPAGRSGSNRGRLASRSSSSRLQLGRGPATSRTGPSASVRAGCSACGSHLGHSHSPRRCGPAQTAIEQVLGCVEHRQLRQHRPHQRRGPHRPATRRSGAPGRSRAARSRPAGPAPPRRRRGTGAAPRRSPAPDPPAGRSAADSGVARVCGPTPTRTTAKSASLGRRSHSRKLSTVDHSEPGSGCR